MERVPNLFVDPVLSRNKIRQRVGRIATLLFFALLVLFVILHIISSASAIVPTFLSPTLSAVETSRANGRSPACACSRQSFPVQQFTTVKFTQHPLCSWVAEPIPPTIHADLAISSWRFLLRSHKSLRGLCTAALRSAESARQEFLDSTFNSAALLTNATIQSHIPHRLDAILNRTSQTFATPFSHVALWASMNMPVPIELSGFDRTGRAASFDMSHANSPCLQDFENPTDVASYVRLFSTSGIECPELFLHHGGAIAVKAHLMAGYIPAVVSNWTQLCALAVSPAANATFGAYLPVVLDTCARVPRESSWVEHDSVPGCTTGSQPSCGATDYLRVLRINTFATSGACDCKQNWNCVGYAPDGRLTACDTVNLLLHHRMSAAWPPPVVAGTRQLCDGTIPASASVRATSCWVARALAMLDQPAGSSISKLSHRLFLSNTSLSVSFPDYFATCAPTRCSVLLPRTLSSALSTTVAVVGGLKAALSAVFGIVVSLLVSHLSKQSSSGNSAVKPREAEDEELATEAGTSAGLELSPVVRKTTATAATTATATAAAVEALQRVVRAEREAREEQHRAWMRALREERRARAEEVGQLRAQLQAATRQLLAGSAESDEDAGISLHHITATAEDGGDFHSSGVPPSDDYSADDSAVWPPLDEHGGDGGGHDDDDGGYHGGHHGGQLASMASTRSVLEEAAMHW